MNRIRTEVGVVIILAVSLLVGIFTVVGFNKTAKDLDRIDEAVQRNQSLLGNTPKSQRRPSTSP